MKTILVDDEVHSKLLQYAAAYGFTMIGLARRAFGQFLESGDRKKFFAENVAAGNKAEELRQQNDGGAECQTCNAER